MKRFLAAVAALVLASTAADAATYHVRPGGNNSNAGTSYAAAWQTIAKANTAARPGDMIYVYTGSYAHFPAPDSAGSNPTGGGRIRYVGANLGGDPITNASARSAITIATGSMSKPYVVLRGLHFAGGLTMTETADRCSVSSCTFDSDMNIEGADYGAVEGNIFNGSRFKVANAGGRSVSMTISYNTFPSLGRGVHGSTGNIALFGNNQDGPVGQLDSTRFDRNRMDVEMQTDTDDTHPQVWFWTRYNTSAYNYWHINFKSTLNVNGQYALRMRDSCYRNLWNGDTIIGEGQKGKIYLSSDGRSTTAWKNSVFENTVDSCRWILSGCQTSYIEAQQGLHTCTISRSVFAASGHALLAPWSVTGRSSITHNTFAGSADNGVVRFSNEQFPFSGQYADTGLSFTNNIVYAFPPAYGPAPVSNYSGGASGAYNYGLQFDRHQAIDSSGAAGRLQKKLISNNNLYSYFGYAATSNGDRSLVIGARDNDYDNSAPGNNAGWEVATRQDSLSAYGSPLFADSTRSSLFDPTPTALLPLDAGAISYTQYGHMSVTPTSVVFTKGIPDSVDLVYRARLGQGTQTWDWNGEEVDKWAQHGLTYQSHTDGDARSDELLISFDGGDSVFVVHVFYDGSMPGDDTILPGVYGTNLDMLLLGADAETDLTLPLLYNSPREAYYRTVRVPIRIE